MTKIPFHDRLAIGALLLAGVAAFIGPLLPGVYRDTEEGIGRLGPPTS